MHVYKYARIHVCNYACSICSEKFSIEKLDIQVPNKLEVIWGLLNPKNLPSKYKNIIVCSFYSPPDSRKNSKLTNHLVGTLHSLSSRYPDCGIIMGADKNSMNIVSLFNCRLRLKQLVDKPTINGRTLYILITNLSQYYGTPVIALPIIPDDPAKAKPSDHSIPICRPHTDRHSRPHRLWRHHTFRPLPASRLLDFGQWITAQQWEQVSSDLSATQQHLET